MKTGIELIAIERQEQIEKHKMSIKQDVEHNKNGELSSGAVALILSDSEFLSQKWDSIICEKMMKKGYKEKLIIAGALIAAEIDRLNVTEG